MFRPSIRNRLLAVAALCLLAASPLRAQWINRDGPNLRGSPAVKAAFKPVVAAPSRSTVRILADGKDAAYGTVVAADGWIVTKFDQIKDADKVTCKFKDGKALEAKVVGVHEKNDLALLKVETKDLAPVEWGESKTAAVGNWLASPGVGSEPVAVGVVSVATRSMKPVDYPPPPLATNPNAGFLGVLLEPAKEGPRVKEVTKDSAAAEAGIQVDDVILQIDRKRVEDPDSMIHLLSKYKAGQTVSLLLRRGEEELPLTATLKKRPAGAGMNRSLFQNTMGRQISRKNGGFPVALQHDTVLKATDCGGPVVDLDGKTVGVNIASAGRVESYALPAEVVRSLLPDLMAGKLPPPAKEKEDKKDDDQDKS
jgi:serine protease Do